MQSQHFLENEKYTYTIAKLAILVQSFLTVGICISIFGMMKGVTAFEVLLIVLLTLDILFIICHLTYRGMYRGLKVVLKRNERNMLLAHILCSLLALVYTFLYMYARTDQGKVIVKPEIALSLWTASLVLGILFFFKKYSNHLK
jgi:hypothetical protein